MLLIGGPVNGGGAGAGVRPSQAVSDGPTRNPPMQASGLWESPDDGRGLLGGDLDEDPTLTQTARRQRDWLKSSPPAKASPRRFRRVSRPSSRGRSNNSWPSGRRQADASDTDALPNSLKPGHTLFSREHPPRCPLDVSGDSAPSGPTTTSSARGDMDENGTVPVQVKLSDISDCRTGLATRVRVNDLEAMDNEQQQALTNALFGASKNMGASGLPQGPSRRHCWSQREELVRRRTHANAESATVAARFSPRDRRAHRALPHPGDRRVRRHGVVYRGPG